MVTLLIPEERRDKANGLVGTASGISFLVTSVISGVLVGLGGMLTCCCSRIAVMALAITHLLAGARCRSDGVATAGEDGGAAGSTSAARWPW